MRKRIGALLGGVALVGAGVLGLAQPAAAATAEPAICAQGGRHFVKVVGLPGTPQYTVVGYANCEPADGKYHSFEVDRLGSQGEVTGRTTFCVADGQQVIFGWGWQWGQLSPVREADTCTRPPVG
ncbi:hypothetical protein [Sphaerisporangium aureirubrum]|uniref:Secreted protein n=1 Tax=Sphaerisporangium aureirubrum TaxID=1544736 RepID=A0ABW1NNX8_9ACTN